MMVVTPNVLRQIENEAKARMKNKTFATREKVRYLISLSWDSYNSGDQASAGEWMMRAREKAIHGPREIVH